MVRHAHTSLLRLLHLLELDSECVFNAHPSLLVVVSPDSWFQKKWGHNVPEFRRRFDAELTAGEGPKRLRNLYFLFLIELRALAKALPFFQRSSFQLFTGRVEEDRKQKEMLLDILQLTRSGLVPLGPGSAAPGPL